MAPEEYISKYWQAAAAAAEGTGLFTSVFIAQGALESGWGGSELAWKHNNHFGIKKDGAKPWHGKVVYMWTDEYKNGVKGRYYEPFRAYPSPYDSFRDRVDFLQSNPRYRANGVFSAKTPQEQADALQRAGYATYPQYASDIKNTIKARGLEKYDGIYDKSGNAATLAAAGAAVAVATAVWIWHS